MKQIKIPFHSMIDLITNSSTEIFVNSESSIEPAKELLAELLKMEGSEKTVDEVFTFKLEYESEYLIDSLSEQLEDVDEDLYKELGLEDVDKPYEVIEKWLERVNEGEIEKPDWMEEFMDDNEINVDTNLVIKSNDPKYDHFLQLLKDFLYSPDYQEGYP